MVNLLFQGAEAKILLTKEGILKDRVAKSYRHPRIDKELRVKRTRFEARVLARAKEAGVHVPEVLKVGEFSLELEFLKGDTLAEKLNGYAEKKQLGVMREVGKEVAKLHNANLIHGDLTTSNMILVEKKVFLIDFGLGFVSQKVEDKAVDLHLLKQALEAKHFQDPERLFKEFLKGYKPGQREEILERLEKVERRGRYKKGG